MVTSGAVGIAAAPTGPQTVEARTADGRAGQPFSAMGRVVGNMQHRYGKKKLKSRERIFENI